MYITTLGSNLPITPPRTVSRLSMNTCLLHFVAFQIFIEEHTEGESMHKKMKAAEDCT